MSLEGKYNQVLLEELMLKEIKSTNKVPNLDTLTTKLAELLIEKPLLGLRPLVSLENNQVKYYENSSSSKWNTTLDNQKRDLQVMYDLTEEFTSKILEQTNRWVAHYENVRRSLDNLEDRIENSLLLKRDTLGYFEYVSDNFKTLESVDLTQTSAKIDTLAGAVMLAEVPGTGSNNQIPLDNVQLKYQTVQAGQFIGAATAPGMGLENSISDENTQWLQLIRTANQTPVTAGLRIQFPELTTISKIRLNPSGSAGGATTTISVLYSQNGVDFLLLPGNAARVTNGEAVIWTFPEIQAVYVKFLFTKNGYIDIDANGNYVYDIGTKTISFYNPGFSTVNPGLLISQGLQSIDSGGTPKEFTKVALHVCESLPPLTRISYFVSTDSGSTWVTLDPLERENPTAPLIIDFSSAIPASNWDSSTNRYDPSRAANQLDTHIFSVGSPYSLNLQNTNELPINYYVPLASVSNVTETSYVVYRNSVDTTSTATVRGIAAGWSYDESAGLYSTILTVKDPNGLIIDLDTSEAIIDGAIVAGSVTLAEGNHTFSTDVSNWAEVASGATDVADLNIKDSLYPWNHKLLIEGYDYSAFTGEDEQIYIGASFWSEMILSYLAREAFAEQPSSVASTDLTVYTRQVDLPGNITFIVKILPTSGDLQSERFRVEYSLSDRTFDTIYLKAVLGTDDVSVTPVLDSYTIKLG